MLRNIYSNKDEQNADYPSPTLVISNLVTVCDIWSSVPVKLSSWISQENDVSEGCSWSNFEVSVRFQMQVLKAANITAYQWFLP